MRVAYVRVSTKHQDLSRQLRAVEDCEKIFKEYQSGKDTNRPVLEKCIDFLRPCDTLVVKSIDRLSRNLKDFLDLQDKLLQKGVSVEILDSPFLSFSPEDADDPVKNMTRNILVLVAELERELLLSRQRDAIETAKQQGKFAKEPKLSPSQVDHVREQVELGIPIARIAKKYGVSRQLIHNVMNRKPPYDVPQFAINKGEEEC